MIKSDRKALRRAALILGIVFLFFLVVLGLQVFTGQAAHQNILFPILPLILLLFGMVWIGFLLFRLRRVDQRRTRALQGDQSLLAAEQPVPDENALSLPTTLQLRPRRRYFLAPSGIIFVGAVIASSIGNPFALTLPGLAIRLAIALVTIPIYTAIMYLVGRSRMQYDIEVNEQGLSVTYNKVRTAVNWSDARFFAVNDPKKPKRPKVYELATRDTVARWMWLPPGMTFSYAFKPPLPLEEYHRQQAVLQLIEAKTHLPLYDIGPSKAK
jgi:hypothetical protein